MSEFRRRLMMRMMLNSKPSIPTENGVYIQAINGRFYTKDEWTLPNEQANGVAVIDSRHPEGGFVISKEEYGESSINFSDANILIPNIISTSDVNAAFTDFSGKSNTEKILLSDSVANSAKYCKNYIFPNGKNGYLPALGEHLLLFNNKQQVVECMSKIGGKPFSSLFYWSSTQGDTADKAWQGQYELIGGIVNFLTLTKQFKDNARAFTTLQ